MGWVAIFLTLLVAIWELEEGTPAPSHTEQPKPAKA